MSRPVAVPLLPSDRTQGLIRTGGVGTPHELDITPRVFQGNDAGGVIRRRVNRRTLPFAGSAPKREPFRRSEHGASLRREDASGDARKGSVGSGGDGGFAVKAPLWERTRLGRWRRSARGTYTIHRRLPWQRGPQSGARRPYLDLCRERQGICVRRRRLPGKEAPARPSDLAVDGHSGRNLLSGLPPFRPPLPIIATSSGWPSLLPCMRTSCSCPATLRSQ